MSEQELVDQLESIVSRQSCVVTIHDSQGHKHLCKGFYVIKQGVEFALDFAHGVLPQSINTKQHCAFTTTPDSEIKAISCAAKIIGQTDRTIEFMAVDPSDPTALRQYFRINFRVPMTATHRPELEGKKGNLFWRLSGQTVDISRTGLLSILEQECPHMSPIHLTLELPDPAILMQCVGHIIRIKRLTRTRWLTAFHFDEITPSVADAITTNCMREQRRQIRTNVKTAD